jgi:hypothetical protein
MRHPTANSFATHPLSEIYNRNSEYWYALPLHIYIASMCALCICSEPGGLAAVRAEARADAERRDAVAAAELECAHRDADERVEVLRASLAARQASLEAVTARGRRPRQGE